MFKDLETERLHLKSIGGDDADFMYREFSTDEVNTYLYDAEPVASIDEAREWIEFYTQPEPRDQHRWILVLKETGEKIGTCGFHCWDRESGAVEIGYDLQPAYWRKGCMHEALEAVICFARDEMQVKIIEAHVAEKNGVSARLAERLGFRKTGETYCEHFRGIDYPHFIYRLNL